MPKGEHGVRHLLRNRVEELIRFQVKRENHILFTHRLWHVKDKFPFDYLIVSEGGIAELISIVSSEKEEEEVKKFLNEHYYETTIPITLIRFKKKGGRWWFDKTERL